MDHLLVGLMILHLQQVNLLEDMLLEAKHL
jgi:hypothetical protein